MMVFVRIFKGVSFFQVAGLLAVCALQERTPAMRFRLRLRILAILAAALVLTVLNVHSACANWPDGLDQSWPGFRGLQNYGRALTALEVPLWTPATLTWKVRIPGEGNSSPIIYGSHVYVTTSYPSKRLATWRQGLEVGAVGLAICTFPLTLLIGVPSRTIRGTVVFLTLSLVTIVLCTAGNGILLPERSLLRAWLLGCSIGGTALLASCCWRSSRSRRIISVALIMMASVLLTGQPIGFSNVLTSAGGTSLSLMLAVLNGACGALMLSGQHLSTWRAYLFGTSSAMPRLRLHSILLLSLAAFGVARTALAQADLGFTRAIICLDRATGTLLWQREVASGPTGEMHHYNSPATPTPAADRDGVYAYFGDSGLVALSHNGRPRWIQRLPFQSSFGAGVSPIVDDGIVVLSSGTREGSYVAALSTITGNQLWRHDRPPGTNNGENRTPGVAAIGNSKAVIIWAWQHLLGYELSTGRELFSYAFPFNEQSWGSLVSSFVVEGDSLYLPMTIGAAKVSLSELLAKRNPVLWCTRSGGADCASPVLVNGLLFSVSAGELRRVLTQVQAVVCGKSGSHRANTMHLCSRTGSTYMRRTPMA
jgi:hypothetical protein